MVVIDAENGTLKVPDIGVTLRTLLACAAEGSKTRPKRVWKIIYTDSNIVIGSVRIKTDLIKKENLYEPQSQ
jgi:hypothetical protein